MSLFDLEKDDNEYKNVKSRVTKIEKNEKYKKIIVQFLEALEEREITEEVLECIEEKEDVEKLVAEYEKNPMKQILIQKYLTEKYLVPKGQERRSLIFGNHNNNYRKKISWINMVQFLRYEKRIPNIKGEKWAQTIDQLNALVQIFLREKYHSHDPDILQRHVQKRKNHNPQLRDILIFKVDENRDVFEYALQILKEVKKKFKKQKVLLRKDENRSYRCDCIFKEIIIDDDCWPPRKGESNHDDNHNNNKFENGGTFLIRGDGIKS